MNARLDFQPPPDDQTSGKSAPVAASAGGGNRQYWPVLLAGALSLIWLGAVGYAGYRAGYFAATARIELTGLAALIGGAISPVALFWLIALVIQRSDPLLERRLGIVRTMNRALAPIERAEERLDQLAARMKRDMDHIEAAVDLAASRIDSLENRFKSEISDLFAATADAEAKAITIKEMLRSEREALNGLDATIGERIGGLGSAAEAFSARIEQAANKSRETVEDASNRLAESAQKLADQSGSAAEDLRDAERAIAERLQDLDSQSADLNYRLMNMADGVGEQIDNLRAAISSLDALDARISAAIEERHRHLAVLAENAEAEAERITGALGGASDAARRNAETALESSESVRQALLKQAEDLGGALDQRLRSAQTTFDRLAETLAARATEADQLANSNADQNLSRIHDAMAAFAAQARTLDEQSKAASDLIAERIESLGQSIEGGGESIRTRAESSIAELSKLADMLADQAGMIASAAGDAAHNIGEAGERMDERTNNLGQLLEDMRRRIEDASGRLESERSALAATSEASANTVLDAAERFRAQSQSLSDHAEATSNRMRDSTDSLFSEIERIETGGRAAADSLAGAVSSLKDEGTGLIETLERSSRSLGDAAFAFGGEREKILEDTTEAANRLKEAARVVGEQAAAMRAAGNDTGGELDRVASRFSLAAATILEMAKKAEMSARETGEGFEKALASAVTRGLRDVGQSMDTLNTMFDAEVNELSEKITRTLDGTVGAMRKAAADAGAESEQMVARLSEQADRLVKGATSFLNKSEEIERRVLASSRDEFVRTSSLLIESLQSASVDIDKILATEVPDDVWQRYLSGDRSIFSRRTVRLADGGTRRRIRKIFGTDREFRDTVLKFFRDFEALMEQVMTRDKHSALSVTLISSEMGKLYVLLAQSLKKIQ